MNLSRRNWLGRLAFYGTPVTAFGYGSLVEKRWAYVTRTEIPLSPDHSHLDGLRIAVMGDFHHDDFGDDDLIRRAVDRIHAEKVDVVLLVGDYISSEVSAMEPLCAQLSRLRARLGVFGVLGNHEGWHFDEAIPRLLGEAGVRLLVNESAEFDDFVVAGLDSYWAGRPDPAFALRAVAKDKPVLAGWHEPDTFDSWTDPRLALQVSGHTHGGQVCAPLYGPILLPQFGKNYPYGHYRKGNRSLFVTRGIGTLNIPARFLCAPEVGILTMRDFRSSVGA